MSRAQHRWSTGTRWVATVVLCTFATGSTAPAWAYSSPIDDATIAPSPGYFELESQSCLAGPSPTTCASDGWVDACGPLWGASDPTDPQNPCWAKNEAQATSWQDAHFGLDPALTETVFDPAQDLFLDTLPPLGSGLPSILVQKSGGAWAAQEEKARFAATTAPIVNPLWYTRAIGSWLSGVAMPSCENYVYRSFFAVERWLDALHACKGDDRCKVKVSLYGMTADGPSKTPGIARRVMTDNEGNPISARLATLRQQGKITSGEAEPFTDVYALTMIPKNNFYAGSHLLIVPSLIAKVKAQTGVDLQALHNELWRGSTLYHTGGDAPVHNGQTFVGYDGKVQRGFRDEWEWHNFMLKRTEGVTYGQFREYRRRSDDFMRGWDILAERMKCLHDLIPGGGCSPQAPNALGKLHPGDTQMWQGDPIAARTILASITPEAFLVPPSMTGQVGFGDNLQSTGLTLAEIVAGVESGDILSGNDLVGPSLSLPGLVVPSLTAASLSRTVAIDDTAVAPAPPDDPLAAEEREVVADHARKGRGGLVLQLGPSVYGPAPYHDPMENQSILSAGGVVNHMWEINPPVVETRAGWPRLVCTAGRTGDTRTDGPVLQGLVVDPIYNTHQIWKDACDLTNQLLDEWGRHLTAKPSCLDPKNLACDWQPRDFVDRFVTRNIGYGSAAMEAEYRICKRWTANGQLLHPDPKIGLSEQVRKTLGAVRNVFAAREVEFQKKLKTVPVQGDDDFGTTRTESETIGDSDFGGGYSYTLAWHAQAYERLDDPEDPRDGQICRMGGGALAKFTADATLFGNEVSIVDALGSASANDGDTGQAFGNTHLYVVGYKIFDTKDLDGADDDGTISLANAYDEPVASDDGKPLLFAVPFQVGWVTITVKAGIAYSYGVKVKLAVDAPQPDECDADNPLFKADGTFAPFADLGVWVAADVSLAGIVGVGVEVALTLVGIELPLRTKVWLGITDSQLSVNFECTLDLILTTLAGELSFYIELFWTHIATFTIVKWDGFKYRFPIFRTPPVSLSLATLPPGTIAPPGGTSCSESSCP